jgi:hypothetical protein
MEKITIIVILEKVVWIFHYLVKSIFVWQMEIGIIAIIVCLTFSYLFFNDILNLSKYNTTIYSIWKIDFG